MNIDIIVSSVLSSSLTGLISGLVVFLLLKPKKKKPRKKKAHAHAMNAAVMNSVVDYQKIRTAEIEIPVIAEDVLTYEGGELGPAYPDQTRLYYPADAISDPDYLETVKRSPLQIQTHQKNTDEYNRDVDGWPTEAWWDTDNKRVMVKGVLHGEDNVRYAEDNRHLPGFGTSAYISFLRIEKTPGTAPNGKPYDAVVRKAVNNHIAILPNVRDPKNVIVAMNAVEEKTVDVSNPPEWVSDESVWKRAKDAADKGDYDEYYAVVTDIYKKMGGKIAHGSNSTMGIDKNDFKSAMNEYEEEKRKEEEAANRIKNAVINELKSSGPASSGPVTSTASGGNAETSTSTGTSTGTTTAPNSPESSGPESAKTSTGTETATASNALPSEEMVKDFATHLGVTFRQTPSLGELASLVGVKATEPAELITALNAKRAEFKKPAAEASNSVMSLEDLMRTI